eukprot:1506616-Pyramimonas_sp.AAC.1
MLLMNTTFGLALRVDRFKVSLAVTRSSAHAGAHIVSLSFLSGCCDTSMTYNPFRLAQSSD